MTTSIAQTCATCGTLNRVVIMTAGLTPGWRIGCSRCGATVIEARGARPDASGVISVEPVPSAEIINLPLPVAGAARPGRREVAPARRRTHPAQRRWSVSTRAGASSGVSLLAACGLVLALLVIESDPHPAVGSYDGGIELAQAGTTDESPGLAAMPDEIHTLAEAGGAEETGLPKRAIRPDTPVRRTEAAPGRIAGKDGPVIPRYRLAAELAMGDRQRAYPDPREGMMAVQLAAQADPGAAAEAEAGLNLTPAIRREIQRRLRLAEHDPKGVDGIFGPATRAAIAAWQEHSGVPATGFITPRTLARLVSETEEAYSAWTMAEKARRARDRQLVAAAPVPRPRQEMTDGCTRLRSGQIAYGQNFRCDVRGLRESLSSVGATLAQALDGSDQRWTEATRRPGDA